MCGGLSLGSSPCELSRRWHCSRFDVNLGNFACSMCCPSLRSDDSHTHTQTHTENTQAHTQTQNTHKHTHTQNTQTHTNTQKTHKNTQKTHQHKNTPTQNTHTHHTCLSSPLATNALGLTHRSSHLRNGGGVSKLKSTTHSQFRSLDQPSNS